MLADATLNARLNRNLKTRGDAVLSRGGVSVSDAIRSLYQYLDEHQEMPSWMRETEETDKYEQRRAGMRDLVGVASLPHDFDVDELKNERLSRYKF